MAGRALAFSDPRVIDLISREFVPVAVEINHLTRQRDDEGRFFRLVSRQGRFGLSFNEALATVDDTTWNQHESHQGLYAATVAGRLLGSKNTRDADLLLEVLAGALRSFQETGDGEDPIPQHDTLARDSRYSWTCPDDGLVLQMGCVDLPRASGVSPNERWRYARNHDYVWITREEMLSMAPDAPQAGDRFPVPDGIARRIARFHLLDCVRGENHSWPAEAIQDLEMTFAVTGVRDAWLDMELSGHARLHERGSWCLRAPRESSGSGLSICCMLNEQGFEPQLLGYGRFDKRQRRFSRFDLVAVGTRWGGTHFNGRRDDVEPAPMGIAMTIAGTAARDRTPPHASLQAYFRA